MKKKVVCYPVHDSTNDYIVSMRNIIREKYELVDYRLAKQGLISFSDIQCIYLNWVENAWSDQDEQFLLSAKKHNVKIIWVFHNRVPHDLDKERIEKAKSTLSFLIDIATHIILHARSCVKYLAEYGEDAVKKSVFIPIVNYQGVYDNLGGDLRKKLNIKEDKLIIGFLGMLKPYKNIELLMDVFKELNNSKLQLLIMGKAIDDNYYKSLEDRAKGVEDVIIKNQYISNIVMKSYLEAIDLLVLPFNKVSSMNSATMIMAFSYGKTVIVPNINTCDEYEDELIYKYDYDTEDEASHFRALKEQIIKAMEVGKEKNAELGRRLQLQVERENSKDVIRKELFKLL